MKILSSPPKFCSAKFWRASPLLSALLLISTVAAAEKIDINTAPVEELVKIIHIGEARAKELISLRSFYSIDELTKIKGIGPSRLKDIKDEGLAWVDPNLHPAPQTQPEPEPQPEPQIAPQTEPKPQPVIESKEATSVSALQEPQRIDINTASSQELQKLTGIGQVLAQRITDARPFYSVDELTKVRGIGAKTLADIETQGLAWVDPALQSPKPERLAEPAERGTAAVSQPIKPQYIRQQTRKPLPVFLIALIVAIFSGAAILVLKKSLKPTSS